ncbi:WD40-repeat-containing domain protein [Flagelloscypha sp. PMI_526]|nr:WD40-repeat-containing domain protein [Flagelloscypha sp. PMI_526]
MAVTLGVHRCRFVDYAPSAITAIAFTPLPPPRPSQPDQSPTTGFGTLVVGHSNGNIDICEWTGSGNSSQSAQAWAIQNTLPGPYPSKVDSLVLVLRNPQQHQPGRTLNSHAGTIWSMSINPSHTQLALGCEDGTIRLVSVKDDSLLLTQKLDRAKCRILSLAWGPPSDLTWSDSWIVAGCSDSSLRKWDLATGRLLEKMSVDKLRGERTLVWSIGVLGDGTIFSGDSLGLVKFWDSRTCTQLQSFKGHKADVLTMTAGPDGRTVYSSGVDQKITQYSLVKTANATGRYATRWVQSSSRRLHSHDVRSISVWPPYSCFPPSHKRPVDVHVAPILASGGLDMSVLLTPAAPPANTVVKIINPLRTGQDATFEESHQRRIAYPRGPSNSAAVHLARDVRLVVCVRENAVCMNTCLRCNFKLFQIFLAVQSRTDGKWLAISDIQETKLFSLTLTDDQLISRKVKLFSSILEEALDGHSSGSSQIVFSPDGSRLVLALARSPHIVILDISSPEPAILHVFTHVLLDGRKFTKRKIDRDADMDNGFTVSGLQVRSLAVSLDCQWLAASDHAGQTMIYNLDSFQHHCSLPAFSQYIQTMTFDTLSPNTLFLAFPDNTIHIFDVELRQFPSWAKGICDNLPLGLTDAQDSILGIELCPGLEAADRHYLLLWGSTWVTKLNLDAPNIGLWTGKKRRREAMPGALPATEGGPGGDGRMFRMVRGYRPLLAVGYLGSEEIMVVERPLVDVLATLTPPYVSEKYGQT